MIKYFPLFILLIVSTPSYAITWKEFWEPFNNGYYPNSYRYRQTRIFEVCKKEIYREQYVPGDIYSPGYVKKWREIIEVPCR
jgi:hypothetical protein